MIKGRFNVNLNRIRSKIGEGATQKAVRITQTLVDGFIRDSPVYRGRFRGSWNVSQGSPQYVSLEGGSPENPIGPPRILVKANSYFPVFYITNGKAYGQILEYGNGKQAPYAVVRTNIASLR